MNSGLNSGLNSIQGVRVALAVVALVAAAAGVVWLDFSLREARVHRRANADGQEQAAASIARLQAQGASLLREAKAHEATIRDLELERRKAEVAAGRLRAELASLHGEEKRRVAEVATLPAPELADRVATQLELGRSQTPGDEAGGRSRVSGAREDNVPLYNSSTDTWPLKPNTCSSFSEATLRKVETALVELDACRAQSSLQDQEVANSQRQLEASAAMVREQAASLDDLKQGLALKDQLLARREAECRAEIKAARGSWLGRAGRTLKYIGVGLVIGVAIR